MSIRLNKKLNENAFNDPTKETIQKSINQLFSDVDSGQVIMPIFQRDLSWTTEKKIDLYNFQLGGFAPVSPSSMNRIGPKSKGMPHVKLLSRTEIEELNEGSLSVIDGQQRISTNYQAYSN
uniref:GmrSD restriction endonuclease domain-containing protein n=1 Tax=Staphylococcus haemolyticus TaxID=1283 RepID=UPI0015D7D599